MPRTLNPWERRPSSVCFFELIKPALDAMKDMAELQARGNRKLKMTFEDQLRAIENELRCWSPGAEHQKYKKELKIQKVYAKT